MSWAFRTMIVPAALVPLARALAACLSPAGTGMFEVGCSADGSAPATHYISTGMIQVQFAEAISDASALHAACLGAGASVSSSQCQALVSASDVSNEQPFDALARVGLALVVEPE